VTRTTPRATNPASRVAAGDHTILLATPEIAGVADPFAEPLVYHDGAYNHIKAHPGARAPLP
jgi:flavin reductase (DIM6/NTAB) family NADH-FMN oxidoreductase RutF